MFLKKHKIIFIFLLTVVLFCIILFLGKFFIKKNIDLYAKSAIVMNLDNKKVLFDKEKDLKLSPGSMTKMISIYIVLEKIESGEIKKTDMVTISRYATSTFGSKVGLRTGEKISVDNLIKCVLLPSGSDAVIALAEYVCGTEETFVGIMNEKAKEMGLVNTHFSNCVGLESSDHYSTAYDMALLAYELTTKYPYIYDYTDLEKEIIYHEDGTEMKIYNTNDMLDEDGINGLKTGSTPQSGYSLTMTYNKGKEHIVYVVMNSPSEYFRKRDCLNLLKEFSY